jgi:hypothetical protein
MGPDGHALRQLDDSWWRLVGNVPGDATGLRDLLALLERAAAARTEPLPALVERLLPAAKELYADMRARKVHHGTLSAYSLAHDPPTNPGLYFSQALDRADGHRMGEGEPLGPAATPPRPRPSLSLVLPTVDNPAPPPTEGRPAWLGKR